MVLWSDYINVILITLCYIALCLYIVFMKSADEIKQNWNKYRCNPPYWIYSSNLTSDIEYCIQNTMNSTTTTAQNEFTSSISMLSNMAATFNEANMSNQASSSLLGDSLGNIAGNIMGVMNNVMMSMTKIVGGLLNMTNQVVGIMMTLLFILDGSMKTMNSLWAGPPGQAVRFIGSCFRKDTLIQVRRIDDNKIVAIDSVCVGDILSNGDVVVQVLCLPNIHNEVFYNINDIFVTGEHYIYDFIRNKWIKVKESEEAILTKQIDPFVYSLVTKNHTIPIKNCLFWDWEDDNILQF